MPSGVCVSISRRGIDAAGGSMCCARMGCRWTSYTDAPPRSIALEVGGGKVTGAGSVAEQW